MHIGLVLLCAAYVLSQFYRAFLAVLAQTLDVAIGAGPDDLSFASGMWFLTFAAMQIPIGWALDRIGPRRTAAVLMLIGGTGGAMVFANATVPVHVSIAMGLIGIGCAPALMASYYIFAREYPPHMFATLGAIMIGVGTLGNIASAAPTAWAAETFGWRETLYGLAAITAVVAIGLWFAVRDPEQLTHDEKGSVFDLLKMPVMWAILPMILVSYAPASGLRGLWISPYLSDVYGASTSAVGNATLIMGIAMIIGSFAYGPMDRWLGTRKWVVFGGTLIMALGCTGLAIWPDTGWAVSVALCCVVGVFGMTYPMIMAHGRAFIPPHLVGRGVTMMNLCSIGGAGLFQVLTGRIHKAAPTDPTTMPYVHLFWFYAIILSLGLIIYLFSRDNID